LGESTGMQADRGGGERKELWRLKCEARICTMTSDFTAAAFSRPTSIYGTEAIKVAPESPDIGCQSGETLQAGRCGHCVKEWREEM